MTTFLAMADLHGQLPIVPPADVVIIAGDVCNFLEFPDEQIWLRWLDAEFRDWLEQLECKRVIGVAGNHDFIFQDHAAEVAKLRLPWTYLEDSGTEAFGLNIWGTPWQPIFSNWAFNATEDEMARRFGWIPNETDIIVAHGPPFGYGDHVPTKKGDRHVGSRAMLSTMKRVRPSFLVCGHIHYARGVYQTEETTVINCSMVNNYYQMIYQPIQFGSL